MGIISYSDYIKEDKSKIYSGKALKNINEILSKRDLNTKKYEYDKAMQNVQNSIQELDLNRNLQNPFANQRILPTYNKETKNTELLNSRNKINDENKKIIIENQQKINNSPVVQEARKKANIASNDLRLAQYQYDVFKEQNRDVNWYDKTIDVPIRALKDVFSTFSLTENPSAKLYKNEDGTKVFLPSSNQLKQENVSQSYETKAGKLLSDIVYNATKIYGSTLIPGGSAIYWGDMFNDNYVNTINEGYSGKDALLYATLSTASELVTEKVLGGISKITPGGSSTLSKTINRTLSKVMKNDKLRSVLSNMLSEGSEEFVQEYVDLVNRNLVLGEKNNLLDSDTFENALYSGLVGMGTGGISGVTNIDVNTNNTGIVPIYNSDGTIDINAYKIQLENARKNSKNQKQINAIDSTLNQLDAKPISISSTINDLAKPNQSIEKSVNELNLPIVNRLSNINELTNNQKNSFVGRDFLENYNEQTEKILSMKERNVIVKNYKQLDTLIDEALNTQNNKALHFGKINENIITKIKNKIQNLPKGKENYLTKNNYDLVINQSEIRHLRDNKNRLTNEEIHNYVRKLPDIITESDDISYTNNNKNEGLRFKKKFDDGTYISFVLVSNKKGTLTAKSIFLDKSDFEAKKRNISPTSDAFIAPNKTSKTNGVSASLVDNNTTISQNSQIAPLPNNSDMQNSGNNSSVNYSKSDIDSFNTYTDSNGNELKLPDDIALNLIENTTLNIDDITKLQSIIETSNINESDNTIIYNGQFDNNNYNITAHKQNDVYLIDNIVKRSINPLPSIKQQTIDNYQDVVDNYDNYKESKFYKNATEKSKFITEENRNKFKEITDLKYYEGISNEATLNEAYQNLNKGGMAEISRWLNQENKISTPVDIAEGWILLESYQEAGDYDSMVQVAKKMRRMGTIAGQTVQAYNIMARLSPEGMVKYAVSELSEAYEIYSKNKSKTWIDENISKFDLTPEETGFIVDTMKEVEQMADGREKNVKLAEIQKMLNDKLPPDRGDGIKAWMRISMLFNPKTQVRNVMGNAIIAPVNAVSDYVASKVDSAISKKTGVRTTGKTDIKSYAKGFKKGLFESYDDFKRGINTRNIQGNRFEVGQAKSFNNDTKIGKALNRVDSLLSFMLDVGDRGFYEASFTNSINNQLVLNNKTEVTQEMIDIATQEALQRTWQDNNNYTRFVLSIRSQLNKINVKGYGLGDVLIPFAKTPANLTKAIVDYSPLGMVKTINEGINLKRSLTNGQFTAQMQHQFVQDLGKATAGTMLYILGYGLAKAGMTTGESDDDKDVSNFMKNTLGVSSYSIKIGDKSYTYDWMQPISAPFAITANIVNKQKQEANLLENIISSLDTAGNILLQQSFLDSLNTVFNNTDGIVSGLQEAILELPSRAIPTLFKQIVDLTDSTQRTSFEYDKPLETMFNKVKAKIPGLSKTLAPSVDTLGREIQRYGGKNNLFNVFLNPANVNTENVSESAKEIYRLYKETGDTTIMPRVAPYYINQNGEKITLDAKQKAEYQKISGDIIETSVKELLTNSSYKNMNDTEKSDIINKIVNYSYNKAREEILNIPMSNEYNKINQYIEDGGKVSDYYLNKEEVDYSYNYPEKYKTITQITTYDKYLNYQEKIDALKDKYNNTTQRKNEVIKYVNTLNLSIPQKAMLIKLNYSSFDMYNTQIINYINNQKMSKEEKQEILTKLGFTIRNGRVYS